MEDTSSILKNVSHLPLLSVVGYLPIFAPSSHAHVAQRASERESGIKVRWCFIVSGYFSFVSLFCTLKKKKRMQRNELFKTCSYLMAVRAIS